MNIKMSKIYFIRWIIQLGFMVAMVRSHGRLLDPPSRSTMWRFGYDNPVNYDDKQLYCGGVQTQYEKNGGKCGVCGDPYQGPFHNEAGGKYANGIIVQQYEVNDIINITVELSANHKGWFEFRICPTNDPYKKATHECMNKHKLEILDEKILARVSRYKVRDQMQKIFQLKLVLPKGLRCSQCVLQWKYNAGNSWGNDPVTNRGCVGCGPQEQFYGCSDISIGRDPVTPIPPHLRVTDKPTTPWWEIADIYGSRDRNNPYGETLLDIKCDCARHMTLMNKSRNFIIEQNNKMRWGVVFLVLFAVARGQDADVEEDLGFELTDEQIAQCGPTGYFADPDDCCRFIQCDYYNEGDENFTVGHNVACMGGSVWNSVSCSCEEPTEGGSCDPTTCNVPEFIATPCPTAGLDADQCCIDGTIVNIVNDTSYYLASEGPDLVQTCPYELLFDFNDCCCDDELFEGLPPMCDHYTLDDIPFADEGVIASGATLIQPGAAGSGGGAGFAAGAAAGASSAKLPRWSNVDFGTGFATGFWVKAEGSGASTVFHNGDAGGLGATVSFEVTQTSGGGYAVSGGVFAQDGASDFYQETSWSQGSWNFVGVSYNNGDLKVYIDDNEAVEVVEAEELEDEPVVKIFKSAAEEAIEAVDNAEQSVRRTLAPIGEDRQEDKEKIQDVLDCIQEIKAELEDNKDYIEDIQRGLTDFRSKRRVYRKAFNKFKKPKRRNDDTRDDLQSALGDVEAAYIDLKEKVDEICAALDKVCNILGNKDILKLLDSGSKKDLKKLKRKLKKLKGKFQDDNPSGDKKFGLRAVDETFPQARRNIDDYNSSGRKKRQAEEDDDDEDDEPVKKDIFPSKFPITLGEDFNGSLDEVFVCDFPISDDQMNAIRESNTNPIMPMSMS
ncbi:unnamed protein product [Owenia fusiformis]|uniref:Chitin-binding type-4 domain-containing protein n=1 Tax=Owenia fusiformis TaxID=6347 RepID=A0A8S4PTR9_OWEFU|nr:unnamed protein product [Owenia fusiformis]